MIRLKYLTTLAIGSLTILIACNTPNSSSEAEKAQADSIQLKKEQDSIEACSQTEKYPNQDKPMALMMRQMADNAQAMKDMVLKGERVTMERFPFIRFHLVEPTDPDILQPQFYENARLFQLSHKELVNAETSKQKEMYNLYIGKCINCHENVCSGPLKRIRKLVIQ